MKAIIFDIDGTLADVQHRVHFLTMGPDGTPDWPGFFGQMHLDPVIEPIMWLNRLLGVAQKYMTEMGEPFAILIVTARPDTEGYSDVTEVWLDKGGAVRDRMYMRDENDRRQDHLVKQDILGRIIEDGYEPVLVIDDRPEVVAMWRAFGLACLQCVPDEPPASSLYGGQVLLDMLVGPAGAGKSLYCQKNYKPEDVISTDEIRRQRFGDYKDGVGNSQEENAWVWRYVRNLIKARMDSGVFTVLDATNLKKKDRLTIMSVVPRNILAQYVLIDRDYDEKIRDRGWRPEELIDKHHKQMKSAMADLKVCDGLGNVMIKDVRK